MTTSLAELTHAIIRQLEKCCEEDWNAMPRSARYPFIARQIEKAQAQYRIKAPADIMLFCALALAGGTDFDRASRIARALDRVLKEHIPFGKAYWQEFGTGPHAGRVQVPDS